MDTAILVAGCVAVAMNAVLAVRGAASPGVPVWLPTIHGALAVWSGTLLAGVVVRNAQFEILRALLEAATTTAFGQ